MMNDVAQENVKNKLRVTIGWIAPGLLSAAVFATLIALYWSLGYGENCPVCFVEFSNDGAMEMRPTVFTLIAEIFPRLLPWFVPIAIAGWFFSERNRDHPNALHYAFAGVPFGLLIAVAIYFLSDAYNWMIPFVSTFVYAMFGLTFGVFRKFIVGWSAT